MGKRRAGETGAADLTAADIEAEADALERAVARKKRAMRALAKLGEGERGGAGEGSPLEPEADLPGADKVQAIVTELNGEGSFEVIKVTSSGQEQLARYDLAAWPEAVQLLVKEHGGGNYLVVVRNGAGQIAGRVLRTYSKTSYGEGKAPAALGGGSSEAVFVRFMEMQQAADARHQQQLETMRLELAKVSAEANRNLLEVLKTQQGGGIFKSAQDVAAIASLFKSDKGSRIDELLDLKELLEDLRGDAPRRDDASLLGVIANALSALVPKPTRELRAGAPTPAPLPEHRPAALPAATKTPPAAPAAPEVQAAEPKPAPPSIAPYIANLRASISDGYTAKDIADTVWKAAKDVDINREALTAMVREGDWAPAYADEFLAQHKAWLDDFRTALEGLISAPAA